MSDLQQHRSDEAKNEFSWSQFLAPNRSTIWDAVWHIFWLAVLIRWMFFV